MNIEWIVAADALPEHAGDVLVTKRIDGGYKVEITHFSNIFKFGGAKIVAWAKLPDPYVASQDEDTATESNS